MSEAQYRNIIKVIVVAAISKQFRRAKIVERVVRMIKRDKLVATKELSTPKLTGSILPSSDDRFMINKNSVVVDILRLSQYGKQYPMVANITVNIRYGLDEPKYAMLVSGTPYRETGVPKSALQKWISVKKNQRSQFRNRRGFYVQDKGKDGKRSIIPYDEGKEWHRNQLEYILNMSIKYSEFKSDFLKPFDDEKRGVQASVNKAIPTIENRLDELYGTQIRQFVVDALKISIG